jgi:hypothetical protein
MHFTHQPPTQGVIAPGEGRITAVCYSVGLADFVTEQTPPLKELLLQAYLGEVSALRPPANYRSSTHPGTCPASSDY